MNWTKDQPTAPGFYWFRSSRRGPVVVEVIHGRYVAFTQGEHDWLALHRSDADLEQDAEWFGPLEPPG